VTEDKMTTEVGRVQQRVIELINGEAGNGTSAMVVAAGLASAMGRFLWNLEVQRKDMNADALVESLVSAVQRTIAAMRMGSALSSGAYMAPAEEGEV